MGPMVNSPALEEAIFNSGLWRCSPSGFVLEGHPPVPQTHPLSAIPTAASKNCIRLTGPSSRAAAVLEGCKVSFQPCYVTLSQNLTEGLQFWWACSRSP